MRFVSTGINGAFVIDIECHEDPRGFFARAFCAREFAEQGIAFNMVQASISWNRKKGTLRGLHYQAPPGREAKMVRCTRGAVFDVIVDLRPDSHSYLQHFSLTLSTENRLAMYIPPGVAHGFQTLVDDTEIFYHMSDYFDPAHARGVRWDDPAFGIKWPADERTINTRDATYAEFGPHATNELREIGASREG
jgi:dTDP-4-dehydrorhamnose 3,5-epimerase